MATASARICSFSRSRAGSAVDLTPGDHDVPPFSLGGQDQYAFSPDGKEIAYASNLDEVEATSTNTDIFVVPVSWWYTEEDLDFTRSRFHAALLARRQIHRLPLASARRLRERSFSIDAV